MWTSPIFCRDSSENQVSGKGSGHLRESQNREVRAGELGSAPRPMVRSGLVT